MQPDLILSADERDEMLRTVMSSSYRLGRLVDNLLALSQIEASNTPPLKEPYPINDVIATVLDQLDLRGLTKNRPMRVDVAEDPLEAPMDHVQVERVVMNLVENAVKYSPPGSPIAIRAWREADELRVAVTDQGIGIPPEQSTAIFDKFFRLQQPLPWARVTPPQGTGLGLAISEGIVREHGGRIWVESQVGQGSTFIFTLPLATDFHPATDQMHAMPVGSAYGAQNNGNGRRQVSGSESSTVARQHTDLGAANEWEHDGGFRITSPQAGSSASAGHR
jgi:two-component system sensor histidine kinase KdpD